MRRIGLVLACLGVLFGGCRLRTGTLPPIRVASVDFDPNDPFVDQRTILLAGELNPVSARTICQSLVYLDGLSDEPISILVYSSGGDGHAYLTISNVMGLLQSPVDVVNISFCGSAAALLMQSATGERLAMRDSIFAIHPGRGRPAELVRMFNKKQNEVFSERTDLPREWFPLDSEYFFTAAEALEYGFIDELIQPQQALSTDSGQAGEPSRDGQAYR